MRPYYGLLSKGLYFKAHSKQEEESQGPNLAHSLDPGL